MNPSPRSVLIVDDCAEDREMCRRYLLEQGDGVYVVLEAESGIEGWELCKTKNPDCVLLDYQLPDFDGLEFVEALNRERGLYRTPVLMLTGQGDERVAARAITHGAQDYLVKGKLTTAGLHRAICHALDRVALLQTTEDQRVAIEKSQKELEQFAFALHYDLQADIRQLADLLESVQKEVKPHIGESTLANLACSFDTLSKMSRSIQDSLKYSLLGEEPNPSELVVLEDVLQGVMSALDRQIQAQHATVLVRSMPTVSGSRSMLWQLFQNLIEIALKFQGADPIFVTVSGNQEGGRWHFRVEDTGIGMNMDSFSDLFSDFRKLNIQDRYPGSGIGLALCKKVVSLHGGRIWVESAQGVGTVFHFTLPVQTGDLSGSQTAPIANRPCAVS